MRLGDSSGSIVSRGAYSQRLNGPTISRWLQMTSLPQQPSPWMQMPQVPPMSIPWSVPSLQQSKLVRFTGGSNLELVLHQKRKLEVSDIVDTRQTKQFITEEKMAAHFRDLHISSTYQQQSPVPSTSTADADLVSHKELNMDLEIGAASIVDPDQAKSGHPKLILSEELKRMQPEPIIPSSLLSKLVRPSMALVLWQPPNKHLRILPSRVTQNPVSSSSDSNNNSNNNNNNSSNNNNNNNNNNNEAIPNLNQTLQSSNIQAFEPMEL
nr:anaphase-promoting complex subunit 1-like isoform X2 [Nomia melanderi]